MATPIPGGRRLMSSSSAAASVASSAPTVEWLPLRSHPVFNRKSQAGVVLKLEAAFAADVPGGWNLAAWDSSASRLYAWNSAEGYLHRLSVRFRTSNEQQLVEAASPSEIILPSVQINMAINNISLNRDGSSILLSGQRGIYVIYVHNRISYAGNKSVCRTVFVGSQNHLTGNNILRILQASWHPCSTTHLGVLSSDSVFRMYDLSSDVERSEQEYFLQPFDVGRCRNAASVSPVAFSFGAEHMWDQFSVFFLFGDGSLYVLCPVVPFGGMFSSSFIKEIYEDAVEFGQKSVNLKSASYCRLAITWLESTFPELVDHTNPRGRPNLPVIRACSYSPADASLLLQGPFPRVCDGKELEDSAECGGRAVALLYCSIGKDSLLVITWSSGQLQVYALTDEVQPLWNPNISPQLLLDRQGSITELAMICELTSDSLPDYHDMDGVGSDADLTWSGHPPRLLRLAVVDLALPKLALDQPLSVFSDPLMSERLYCLHGGGIDLIMLHYLPFSNLAAFEGRSVDDSVASDPLSIYPILSTAPASLNRGEEGSFRESALLCGFVIISDSFGDSQAVAITSSLDCILLETRGWSHLLPAQYLENGKAHDGNVEEDINHGEDYGEGGLCKSSIVSRDILVGPKAIIVPDSTSLRSLNPESIEGRSTLHHYIKLFHENSVEYAHKVHIELKQHGNHLKAILGEQHLRLKQIGELLKRAEEKQPHLEVRINHAVQVYRQQESRLQSFKNLPATEQKPLSQAEREFKAQLERFQDVELQALNLSVEALNARLRKSLLHSLSPGDMAVESRRAQAHVRRPWQWVPDAQRMLQLKASMEKLSRINDTNVNMVKLIEQALHDEGDKCHMKDK